MRLILSVQVVDVLTGDECFLAMLEDGSVATWGRGDQLFCNEQGAGGSEDYTSFLSVKVILSDFLIFINIHCAGTT